MIFAVVSSSHANQQWQKFVAATDTAPRPPTSADDDPLPTPSSSVTSKSVSATSAGTEQKDEMDLKLQDFLAVCWLATHLMHNISHSCGF